MAHQDYVSRKTNKKNNPYKSNKQAPQQNGSAKLKVIAVITVCAIIAFIYGLWKIDSATETTLPVKEKEVPVITPKTTLPAPPKEKWDYPEKLKTKEVEEGQYEVETKGPYKLQCGSFRTQKQAEVLKANIAFVGLESYIRQAKGSNSTWYQVYLGPYPRKRGAEKDKHRLRSNNINYCQVLLWK
ncbi:SPOR domain-containing protein [Thalassotalea piscium]|uniref:Cell division protein FtsN n=1 Tax=Thalassotalea piscium TaxID=1230533 RepID=A0A7X0NJN6_9GAMM|nr:SPOR domain-containing protein [Thalassotalea piscium]MBB6544660.1 cell division protein FtsN [Thalassotalea piscium]